MKRLFVPALLAMAPTIVRAQGTEGFTYARVVGILFGLVDVLMAIGLTFAVIMIVYSGIMIMTGRDVAKAKQNIWYAILGSAIVIGVNVILATIQHIVTTGTL